MNYGHAAQTIKDALGRVMKTVYADGSFADVEYGAFGSTTKTYDQRKTSDPAVYTERQSDLAGRLTDVYLPAVTDADPASATFNQSVRPHWVYAYDKNGRETGQLDPKGQSDPAGHLTTFTYDDYGQRTSRTMPPDGDGDLTNDTETWTYDAFGRMKTHTDFKTQTTAYAYDDTAAHGGRLLGEYRFAAGVAALDASGTIRTAYAAERTDYHYDNLGRQDWVKEYAASDMTTAARATTYAFDPVTGGTTQVTSPEGVLNHAYDPATGRLVRTWTASNDTTYQYDGQGRLWKVIVTKLNGQSLTTPRTTEYKYDAIGNLDLTTFDNGTPGTAAAATADDLKHDYAYDVVNRLDTLAVTRGTTALFDQNYDYESDGQKDKVTEHRYTNGSGTVTTVYDWTYDGINRLTDESYTNSGDPTKNYAANYKFDLSSNRVSKTQTGADAATTVSTYNARDEMATTQTNGGPVVIPQYDPNGNTLSDGTRTFTWDLRNRMESVTTVSTGVTTNYTYDQDGVLVSKKTGTGPTRTFVNDPMNPTGYSKPVEERVNGNLDTSYAIGLTVLGQSNATAGYLSLVQDGQGKTRSVMNLSGVDVQPSDYDAYGNALQQGLVPITVWLSPDGYFDMETGQFYQIARYIDRETGTAVSTDPTIFGAGEWQNANLRLYAGGNPVSHFDPSGRFFGSVVESLAFTGMRLAFEGIRIAPYVSYYVQTAAVYSTFAYLSYQLVDSAYYDSFDISRPDAWIELGDLLEATSQTMTLLQSVLPAPQRPGTAYKPAAPQSAAARERGMQNGYTQGRARMGNYVHYDRTTDPSRYDHESGPTTIANRYDRTTFRFAKRGEAGVDITYLRGDHPSTYPGSKWPAGVDQADFKPDTPSGRARALPSGVFKVLYDPDTGEINF